MFGIRPRRPSVSVVVVAYNARRQVARTLHSLSAAYQRHIAPDAYEVIVVDNGSTPSLDPGVIDGLSGRFRLLRIDGASPSPARAINRGLAEARGEVIGVMVDGARIVTPGLLHFARHGAALYDRAVVAALGWHLGFDTIQRLAQDAGYDDAHEDALLASIDWPSDGYRLFEIAALDGASDAGWLGRNAESNALFLTRATWSALGGVDERFDAPGGGLLNLDTYRRAVEMPGAQLVVLLGEATFHQQHGGVATNADAPAFRARLAEWSEQYRVIRQAPWAPPEPHGPRTFLGQLPRTALVHFVRTTVQPVRSPAAGLDPPLGHTFDGELWSLAPPTRPADPVIARIVDLAHAEFRHGRYAAAAAVARLARAHAPDEPEPQRLLAHASAWCGRAQPPREHAAAMHAALGDAYGLLGDGDQALAAYRSALALDGNFRTAHLGLARLRMPGDEYHVWLRRFHETLRPHTYLEIGVLAGFTLALAGPPTRAVGVDPEAEVTARFSTETHLFTETSDAFFARRRLDGLLEGRPLPMAFVDGLHTFDQCLRDFINLEPSCGPRSLVLLHDTVPLDEITQRRQCETTFWTGDVWKMVLVLTHYRPDLDIFTIATGPTGLTVVTGLDPSSRVLAGAYDEAVERFMGVPFSAVDRRRDEALAVVPNDWEVVSARLRSRGIFPPDRVSPDGPTPGRGL